MTLRTAYYQDMDHALDTVEMSKTPDGAWVRFRETIPGARDQSYQGTGKERGEALDTYVAYCRSYSAPYLGERASAIATLSAQLQATGLHAVSMKRHQVWSRSGSKLNPHRVLRGQLSTAWRKTVREQRSSTMGRIAVLVNLAVSYGIPTEQIHWSTAATLALADIAKKAGRSVDLYGVAYGSGTFQSCTHVICIPLILSHHVWSIHNTALATSEACFRRLCFRLWEIDQSKYGPLDFSYGYPGQAKQIKEWVKSDFAKKIGIPEQAIYLGCTQADNINNMESAKTWLDTAVHQLDSNN